MREYDLGAFVEPLCTWYEKNKRSMPWRDDATPYHVWLSEIMLQQTRIEAVKAYYARFIERLPDVWALAEVPEEELLKLWEGLGYYNRARNLQKAAKLVVERYEGTLPADYDLLLELPGIGNYTAGAIASIAYGVAAPAVDGNVLRVAMRCLNCDDDIQKQSVRRNMEKAIMAVIPKEKPGEFNQALMELGEVICIPNGRPLCEQCPLAEICAGHAAGREIQLPVKPPKKARRIEKRTIFVVEYNGTVAIVKRPDKGLLAGLWEFPSEMGHLSISQIKKLFEERRLSVRNVERLSNSRHVFSHVEWDMRGYRVVLEQKETQENVDEKLWVPYDVLKDKYALPVAFHPFLP